MSQISQSSSPPALPVWGETAAGPDAAGQDSPLAGVSLAVRLQRQLAGAGFASVDRASLAALPAGGWGLAVSGRRLIDARLLAALSEAGPGFALVGDGDQSGECAAVTVPVDILKRLTDADEADLRAAVARRSQAGAPPLEAISPASLDPYVQTSRRAVPVRLMPLKTLADVAVAEATLLPDAQKGVLDWPARFLHPPVENRLVRLLWPTRVTPNQISVATFALGLAAAVLFVVGQFGWGLAVALVCGALDGVDGKLARTKLMVTPIGEWEHVSDKIVEYLWYLCLAIGLVRHGAPMLAVYAGLVAALGMGADIAVAGMAQRRLGKQIDDLGPLERIIRFFGARRNTHMWLLVPFAFCGAWLAGLVAIAASTVITLALHLWRTAVAVRRISG